jgi:hypothetical protein
MPAIFEIDVLKFRPIGSLTTTTIKMTLVGAAPIAGEEGVGLPSGVFLIGNYMIRTKPFKNNADDPTPAMQVKFRVKTPGYLLQGIAFSNRTNPDPSNNLGQKNFTEISIAPENGSRVLTVTNARAIGARQSYDYLILIQEVATGGIGIIDPEWENE